MNDPILDQIRKIDPDASPVDESIFGRVEFGPPELGRQIHIGNTSVPYLRGWLREDGTAFLSLDDRFGLEITDPAHVQSVTHFVAEAIAIGAGLASIERTDIRMPFRR
jgi:hypothetical protein